MSFAAYDSATVGEKSGKSLNFLGRQLSFEGRHLCVILHTFGTRDPPGQPGCIVLPAYPREVGPVAAAVPVDEMTADAMT
jgi:hypothetical protein